MGNIQAADWNGIGLPPVGTRVGVNMNTRDGSYEPALVVAHVPHRGEKAAVVVYEEHEDWNWATPGDDCFIPWGQVKRSA